MFEPTHMHKEVTLLGGIVARSTAIKTGNQADENKQKQLTASNQLFNKQQLQRCLKSVKLSSVHKLSYHSPTVQFPSATGEFNIILVPVCTISR